MGFELARHTFADVRAQCAHVSWVFLCFTAVTLFWQKLWLVQKFNGLTNFVAVQEAIHDDVRVVLLLAIARICILRYQLYTQQQGHGQQLDLPLFAISDFCKVTPSLRGNAITIATLSVSFIYRHRHLLLLACLTAIYLALQWIALFGAMQSYVCMAEASISLLYSSILA